MLHFKSPLYLNSLSLDVDDPLAEIHADGGVGATGELAGAEAVGETRLADTRVPDHDHLERPAAPAQGRHAVKGAGELK